MTHSFSAVAAITMICYLGAMAIKGTKLDNKWLPVICGGLGGILGVVSFLTMPGYPAEDFVTAIAVGIASGFAATGVNQTYKQLIQKDDTSDK